MRKIEPKKILKKFKKVLPKIKKKNIKYYLMVLLLLVIIVPLYLAEGAMPGDFFYQFDRAIEEAIVETKFTGKSKINYQLELAGERIEEMSEVKLETERSEIAMQAYEENLTRVEEELKKLNQEENKQEVFEDSLLEVLEVYIPSYKRDLISRHNEIVDYAKENELVLKPQRNILVKALNHTEEIEEKIFELGLYNISDNYSFETYANEQLIKMNREYQKISDYEAENFTLIKDVVEEDDLQMMQDWLNKAREIQREALNSIEKLPSKEVYELYKQQDEYYEKIDAKLVELSQSGFQSEE